MSVKGTAFKRIKLLGADKVAQVDAMLFKATPYNDIARHIQTVWGEITDVSVDTLAKQLERYKIKELAGAWLVNATDDDGNLLKSSMSALSVSRQNLDAHELLMDLVVVQQTRLNKVYNREKDLPTTMAMVTKEVELYSNLLMKLANVQLDLGFLKRAPITIVANVAHSTSVIDEARRVALEVEARTESAIMLDKVLNILVD